MGMNKVNKTPTPSVWPLPSPSLPIPLPCAPPPPTAADRGGGSEKAEDPPSNYLSPRGVGAAGGDYIHSKEVKTTGRHELMIHF